MECSPTEANLFWPAFIYIIYTASVKYCMWQRRIIIKLLLQEMDGGKLIRLSSVAAVVREQAQMSAPVFIAFCIYSTPFLCLTCSCRLHGTVSKR